MLHDFNGGDAVGTDGSFPSGGLIFDSARNLYGATAGAGAYGYGTVFETARQPQARCRTLRFITNSRSHSGDDSGKNLSTLCVNCYAGIHH